MVQSSPRGTSVAADGAEVVLEVSDLLSVCGQQVTLQFGVAFGFEPATLAATDTLHIVVLAETMQPQGIGVFKDSIAGHASMNCNHVVVLYNWSSPDRPPRTTGIRRMFCVLHPHQRGVELRVLSRRRCDLLQQQLRSIEPVLE